MTALIHFQRTVYTRPTSTPTRCRTKFNPALRPGRAHRNKTYDHYFATTLRPASGLVFRTSPMQSVICGCNWWQLAAQTIQTRELDEPETTFGALHVRTSADVCMGGLAVADLGISCMHVCALCATYMYLADVVGRRGSMSCNCMVSAHAAQTIQTREYVGGGRPRSSPMQLVLSVVRECNWREQKDIRTWAHSFPASACLISGLDLPLRVRTWPTWSARTRCHATGGSSRRRQFRQTWP